MRNVHIVIATALICCVPALVGQQTPDTLNLPCYTTVDLGSYYSVAQDGRRLLVNSQGSVIGGTTRWNSTLSGFVYRNGSTYRLPSLGGAESDALGINSRGQINGQSFAANENFWRATLWTNGKPTELKSPFNQPSYAQGLNDAGDSAGGYAVAFPLDFHAAAWFKGKSVYLGTPGEVTSYASGINNLGQVIGFSNYPDGSANSFIYQNGIREEIRTAYGNNWPGAINNFGVFCGSGSLTETYFGGFLYKDGHFTNFDQPPVWYSTCAGINDQGHAVGDSSNELGASPFIWRNASEGMVSLNKLLPLGGDAVLTTAHGINNRGQITAAGPRSDGLHAYLLNPVVCGKQCDAAPPGLIGWWSGDGNTVDSVSQMNGTMLGGGGYAQAVVRKGFIFDGVDDAIDVPSPTAMSNVTTKVTIAAWINPSSLAGAYSENYIFAYYEPNVSEGISFNTNSDGYFMAYFQAAQFAYAASIQPLIQYDGMWKHVTLTADTTTGEVLFYLNGVPVQTTMMLGTSLHGEFVRLNHLSIGRLREDWGHFNGQLDELQVFNSVLSPSQVGALYAAGAKGVCRP